MRRKERTEDIAEGREGGDSVGETGGNSVGRERSNYCGERERRKVFGVRRRNNNVRPSGGGIGGGSCT